jgi:hypothetical protein
MDDTHGCELVKMHGRPCAPLSGLNKQNGMSIRLEKLWFKVKRYEKMKEVLSRYKAWARTIRIPDPFLLLELS